MGVLRFLFSMLGMIGCLVIVAIIGFGMNGFFEWIGKKPFPEKHPTITVAFFVLCLFAAVMLVLK